MSAGCFPVATHVGGMTNIVLDGYNGILCSPSEDSLYKSLIKVLEMNEQEYNTIVRNAYNSSVMAFSIEVWKQKWSEFIDEVISVPK
jgi:glycosyltransferase involved in cell wall biosynthesis